MRIEPIAASFQDVPAHGPCPPVLGRRIERGDIALGGDDREPVEAGEPQTSSDILGWAYLNLGLAFGA